LAKELVPARKELIAARAALEQMRRAASFTAFESSWQDCLTRIERSWNKSKGAFADSNYQPWRGSHESVRKSDPLLRYLSHARDADEHTVADTLGHEPGSIGINPASGNSLYIESLTVRDGVMSIRSPQPIAITIQPGRVKLLPAKSRGVTYDPPSTHLGGALDRSDPDHVAERGVEYYERFLDEAEMRFGRGKA